MDTIQLDTIQFNEVREFAQSFADDLERRYDDLISILLRYESHVTAVDEVTRSLKCLRNIDVEQRYFTQRVNHISAFLPLNLPLYSLVLFGVVPSFLCNAIYVRPPVLMRNIIRSITELLDITHKFPQLHVLEANRNEFISSYVSSSDVVVFTGKHKNALAVQKKIRGDALFIFTGAGINPVLVTESADIPLAVDKVLEVKTFNSGQDCASPDTILIHEGIAEQFTQLLLAKLSKVGVGEYLNHNNEIGPLVDLEHINFLGDVLIKHQHNIIYGGIADFRTGIIHPTVISTDLVKEKNYTEFFAPVFFLSRYRSDSELSDYFGSSSYIDNAMYLSVFGESNWAKKIRNTVVLSEKIILDIEDGNSEFGGYGPYANMVSIRGKEYYHPILLSREFHKYFHNSPTSQF